MLVPSPGPPRQPWSDFHVKIRNFSQQCESFEFDDCIDAAQFFAPFLLGGSPTSSQTQTQDQGQDQSESPSQQHRAALLPPPFWSRLKRLNIRNSYMMKEPYLRVASRIEALTSVHSVFVAIGRAAYHMPELQFARVCQYVLNDGRLEWFVLTYECYAGKATLRIRGFAPAQVMVDAWRHSIASKRLECEIHVETIDPTAPEG